MFVQDIHELVSLLAGKNLASKRPPEELDKMLWAAVLDVFTKYHDHYVKTKKISRYLEGFKRQFAVTISNGVGQLPPDYELPRDGWRTSSNGKVALVEDAFWDGRKDSKVNPPSLTKAIARIEFDGGEPPAKILEVVPSTVTSVTIRYFRTPAKPKYAYTIVGTRYVFDEGNSVDVEMSALILEDLKNRVLSSCGVNQHDPDVIRYTEMLKNQEQRK